MAKGIARFGILCSLALFTHSGHAATVSDLLISEIMVNPAALSDARGEWLELYNPTTQEINLRDITIGDDGGDRHQFESDLLILPGEYLTLARSVDPGFVPDYVYDHFTLANSGDEIVFSAGLTELLRLDYDSGFDTAGHSRELERLPMLASNYILTLASLDYGLGDIGTPGSAGTGDFAFSSVPLPATVWLFITGILALFSPLTLPRPKLSSLLVTPSSPRFTPSSPRKRGSHITLSPIPA